MRQYILLKLLLLCLLLTTVDAFAQLAKQNAIPIVMKIPDTGQTTSYTSTVGEDADYLINPPSFTNNGNGTVTDNVTGLMWQKIDGGEMTFENAILYCSNLSLGNHTDWRLPTSHEAFSILNLDHLNPAIDTNYFTKTLAEYWWTSERQSGDTTKVWVTNSGGGVGAHPKNETISAGGIKHFNARAVRTVSSPVLPGQHFANNNDGTITDYYTGLIWQRVPNSVAMTWENALTSSENLTLAGYTDWRLPNIKELQSLNDERVRSIVIDTSYFKIGTAVNYWSSTTQFNTTANAWFNSFLTGITTYGPKTTLYSVLCVRGNSVPLLEVGTVKLITPNELFLEQNYPNPFNPSTTINYTIREAWKVSLKIYDMLGNLVAVLENNKEESAGSHQAVWNTTMVPSGVYIYRLTGQSMTLTRKMILVK